MTYLMPLANEADRCSDCTRYRGAWCCTMNCSGVPKGGFKSTPLKHVNCPSDCAVCAYANDRMAKAEGRAHFEDPVFSDLEAAGFGRAAERLRHAITQNHLWDMAHILGTDDALSQAVAYAADV